MSRRPPPTDPLALGRWSVDRAQASPHEAHEASRAVLGRPDAPEMARFYARWGLGLTARELGDLAGSEQALRGAAEDATRLGEATLAAEVTSSLSLTLAYLGRTDEALLASDRAAKVLRGGAGARNLMQRSLILQRLGRLDEALAGYGRALRGLRRGRDRLAEARLLANRGVLFGFSGEVRRGIRDLSASAELAEELGQSMILAGVAHNLAFLESRRGDIPAALEWFDRAETAYRLIDSPPVHMARLEGDRAAVLADAGLWSEARDRYRAAIGALEALDVVVELGELRLAAAAVTLAAGGADEAAELAQQAESDFGAHRRTAWCQLARLLALQAAAAAPALDGTTSDHLSRRAAKLGGLLLRAGLPVEADDARILAGRLAVDAGDRRRARRLLRSVAEGTAATALQRSRAAYARALLFASSGQEAAASAAVASGLEALRSHQAGLGAMELRAGTGAHARSLISLGVALALEAGDAWSVLKAVEAWRSFSARLPPVTPPVDGAVADRLTELRIVASELAATATTGAGQADLIRRQARLETELNEATRKLHGTSVERVHELDAATLVRDLGDRQLVCFFTHEGRIHGVVVSAGGARLVAGPFVSDAEAEVESSLFSLRRLAAGHGSAASQEVAHTTFRHAVGWLSDALIEPLALEASALVVVPTGALHRLPWGALPALRGLPVSVAPAVSVFQSALARLPHQTRGSRAAIIAGPGLAGAQEEVALIARRYSGGVRLTGRNATAERVLEALGYADLAHIAAHGNLRSDNPLFSSVLLHDGPVTIYDFERVKRMPRVVVMPACDSASSEAKEGDELLGLAAALLRMGVASLVAPVVSIPDRATKPLMAALHTAMIRGQSPSSALASATVTLPAHTPADVAVVSAFVALGA